ncbi:MAG: SIMPL domain-containing protein [Candidatus Paceibacterota bacterium]|jgi:hypothetical protein
MNIPEKIWQVTKYLLSILIIFFVIISIKELKSIGYIGANPNAVNSITVNGTGDAVAIPDIATFSFSVTETAKTVADAQTQATTKTNAVLKAIKDGGVADKDIQTTSYSINPHYEYQNSVCTTYSCPPSKSILTGYEVSQSIQVKVRDLSKAGALFTTIGSLNVQNVNGLSFSVDKPESVQAEARSEAIADAQEKADKLAKELGVSLVRISSFYESNNQPTMMKYGLGEARAMALDAVVTPPSIPAGEQKITSNVSITYEIE